MKYRLLDILCCPECGSTFHLKIFEIDRHHSTVPVGSSARCADWCALANNASSKMGPLDCRDCYEWDISEGKLTCTKCDHNYPIINGVPRILSKPLLMESVNKYHSSFLQRYGNEFEDLSGTSLRPDKRKLKTLHAFSYQWTTFVKNFDYYRDLFLSFVHPFLGPDDFGDRIILDVGCGSGRPASVAASLGAEVVATDISEAVQTAQSLVRHYPMVHIIQSDVYSLPFRPRFDFVYCVGVIQHLPDPDRALRSISKVISPGHRLVIWVYGIREFWYRPIDWMRKLTVKLPFKVLHGISIGLAAISEVSLLIPYRVLSRIAVTKRLAEKIPGRIFAKFPFRENVLGWFDRLGAPVTQYFSKADVETMLQNAGFREIAIVARPDASASWVAQAIRGERAEKGQA